MMTLLSRAKAGCQESQDDLIVQFLPQIEKYVKRYGGNDPDELESELMLTLVETVRLIVPKMVDDRIDRVIGARLYFSSLHFLRREKLRRTKMVVRDGLSYDTNQEELEVESTANAICLSDKDHEVLDMLMEGHTVSEVAEKIGVTRQTINLCRRRLRDRYKFHA